MWHKSTQTHSSIITDDYQLIMHYKKTMHFVTLYFTYRDAYFTYRDAIKRRNIAQWQKSVGIFNVAIHRHFKKRHNFHQLRRLVMSLFVSFCDALSIKIHICDAFQSLLVILRQFCFVKVPFYDTFKCRYLSISDTYSGAIYCLYETH